MDLVYSPNKTKELDDALYCKGHTIGVLVVRNIERRSAALHLARQEW